MTPIVGTPITTPVSTASSICLEYLTLADVRAEYGEDVAAFSDAQLQRRIDRLVADLEAKIGHTFGRALIARSTATENVQVTDTVLTIGGHSFDFVTYTTLYDLVAAVNTAGHAFSLELLAGVRPDTPSTLLSIHAATPCGPDAEDRAVLCLDALYCKLSGDRTSHLWLPLPLQAVTEVIESGVTLTATAYWAVPGDSWLIRKACACVCASEICGHPRGRWLASYPGNIEVTYVPQWWGRVPADLQGVLLDAFGAKLGGGGAGDLIAENFGEYSYRRGTARVDTWDEILGGAQVRRYATKFQP
jgi:hypothetical protein